MSSKMELDFGASCANTQCIMRGLREKEVGLEFYVATRKNCKVILCYFCRNTHTLVECPQCGEILKGHGMRTKFSAKFNEKFNELEQDVKYQLEMRDKVMRKFGKYKEEIGSDLLNEYIEEAIQARMSDITMKFYEVEEKIKNLVEEHRRLQLMEVEDDSKLNRPLPKFKGRITNNQPNYSRASGFIEGEYHLCRIKNSF